MENVNKPIIVVNIPVFFDLTQPKSDRNADKEIIPKRRDMLPTSLGRLKSLSTTLIGYPLVVIIKIFVMAKTVTRKEPAAITAALSV